MDRYEIVAEEGKHRLLGYYTRPNTNTDSLFVMQVMSTAQTLPPKFPTGRKRSVVTCCVLDFFRVHVDVADTCVRLHLIVIATGSDRRVRWFIEAIKSTAWHGSPLAAAVWLAAPVPYSRTAAINRPRATAPCNRSNAVSG